MMIATRKSLRLGAALGLALLLAGSAAAAVAPKAKPKTYPTGAFAVAGHALKAADILDARALPDMGGKPSLMITVTAQAAAAIHPGSAPLDCTLDGKPLGTSPAGALAGDHVLQISGEFGDYDATAALARRISGRDPLPDAESDE
jgi:hypothetical protein